MQSLSSLSYLLAIALKELFPETEIEQIKSTSRCFFCDIKFAGEFNGSLMGLLEERMRAWAKQKIPFQELNMVSCNAAELLEHYGEKKLAQKVRREEGLMTLLRLDRFFFFPEGEIPKTTADIPYFKLVCYRPFKRGIRLLGAGAFSKDHLKQQAHDLKRVEAPQKYLEELGLVSWVGEHLVWEPRAQALKEALVKKILEMYQGFDLVSIFFKDEIERKKILIDWIRLRGQRGVQFQEKKLQPCSQEAWDAPCSLSDQSWGEWKRAEDINSFLHIITQFLKILAFDYEVVSIGKMDPALRVALEGQKLSWISRRSGGTPSRGESKIEFLVVDRLGQKWMMSSLQVDRKCQLVQMTVCVSLERCIALLMDRWEGRISSMSEKLRHAP